MKTLSFLLLVSILSLAGCSKQDSAQNQLASTASSAPEVAKSSKDPRTSTDSYSLSQAAQAVSIDSAIDRKIIRDADLTIEVNSTNEAQQKVTSIAESHGGFVVASESKQRENVDPAKRTVDVKLVVRVPSIQFNSALDQIQQLATHTPHRNVTGQDVTEEFIDLQARIKTQKALELQFLEIMKQANKVVDALEVQRQIADVRTEIEKLEGRKRFLENRSTLSTITVNIQTPMPIVVSASGFGHTVRQSVSEALDIASALVLFFVRFVIVITPILVFVVLPLGLIALYFRKRAHRVRLAHQLEPDPVAD
jgi:hypothetical protein